MKHKLPPDFTEDEIKISVAGCGGNGSQFLNGLARMHIALAALGHPGLQVTAYDPDVITEANVGRQLFSPGDIGQSKSHVIINRINNFFGLKWEGIHGYLTSDRGGYHTDHFDILVGCVDSIRARKQLAQSRRTRYWLDLGNTDKKGQVILGELEREWNAQYAPSRINNAMPASRKGVAPPKVVPVRLPHVLDIFPELKRRKIKEDDAPSCSLAEALERQDLFINQTVSTFALQLLWQFIRQGGLDIHGYFINLETGRVTPLPIKDAEPKPALVVAAENYGKALKNYANKKFGIPKRKRK